MHARSRTPLNPRACCTAGRVGPRPGVLVATPKDSNSDQLDQTQSCCYTMGHCGTLGAPEVDDRSGHRGVWGVSRPPGCAAGDLGDRLERPPPFERSQNEWTPRALPVRRHPWGAPRTRSRHVRLRLRLRVCVRALVLSASDVRPSARSGCGSGSPDIQSAQPPTRCGARWQPPTGARDSRRGSGPAHASSRVRGT